MLVGEDTHDLFHAAKVSIYSGFHIISRCRIAMKLYSLNKVVPCNPKVRAIVKIVCYFFVILTIKSLVNQAEGGRNKSFDFEKGLLISRS